MHSWIAAIRLHRYVRCQALKTNCFLQDAAVLLPFELPSNVRNEHNLHFSFKEVNVTQKIRGSVTYFVEENDGNKREAKMDYVLHFPAIRFLKFATIGR